MKAIISTLGVLAALVAVPMRAEILEQVLVKVNGDIITKTDLEQRQIAELRQRLSQKVDQDALKNDDELKKALAEVTPMILVETIDEILLVQLGREKGYRLSDEQFKNWLDNLRKTQNLGDDQKFQQALAQEGMSLDDLRKNVEKQFLVGQVQRDEVGSKLQITEEEARQHYLEHKEQFAEPATATLREILIEVPTATKQGQAGVNVAKDDEAAERAATVRTRIASGEDFTKVAVEVSAAPSKANGGLVGPINVSELSPALQQSLETMKPGDVSQPMRTQRGYLLIKLETLKPATIQPFDSVRDLVADKVAEARQEKEFKKFLARIRGQAIIEWKNEELKRAYEKQLASVPAGGD